MRQEVWTKWVENKDSMRNKGWIPSCTNQLFFPGAEWHCGHVVAASKGGPLNVSNLRPICASCNRNMGTMDLNEYLQMHCSVVQPVDTPKLGARVDHTTTEVEALLRKYWVGVSESLLDGKQESYDAGLMEETVQHISELFCVPLNQVRHVNGLLFGSSNERGRKCPFLTKKRKGRNWHWVVSPLGSELTVLFEVERAQVLSPRELLKRKTRSGNPLVSPTKLFKTT